MCLSNVHVDQSLANNYKKKVQMNVCPECVHYYTGFILNYT